MKHEWEDKYIPEDFDYFSRMFRTFRKCKHCGKIQEYAKKYTLGRVVGGRWHPLAGRCTGVYENIILKRLL
jgi:hypothetical protein